MATLEGEMVDTQLCRADIVGQCGAILGKVKGCGL